MARELLDEQLSLNGTLPRTLAPLLFRPGFLTREYAVGRIARYVRPFRLFLVSSLLFFVTLSYRADVDNIGLQGGAESGDPSPAQPVEGDNGPRWQTVNIGIEPSDGPVWARPLLRRMQAQEERLNSVPPRVAMAAMMDALLQASARMSLLLVPAFAALLLALHFRRRRKYVEHFVFALHLHAFTFLLLIPLLLLGGTWLWILAALWWTVYLCVALKRAYGQSWWLAGVKCGVVAFVYPTVLSIAAGIAALAALLFA